MERGLFLNQEGLTLEQSLLIFKRVSWAKPNSLMMSPPFISPFLFRQKSCFDKEKTHSESRLQAKGRRCFTISIKPHWGSCRVVAV